MALYSSKNRNNKNILNNNNNTLSINKESFPTLNEVVKSSTKNVKSFASVAKKVEAKEEVKLVISDVKPGWVHIRKHKGQIQFKSNPTYRNTYTEEDVIYEEKRLSNYLFIRRVTLQQEARDIENERLGDLSPYWNTKTILEMHEDDHYQEGDYEEDYVSCHSDSSDH